MLVVCRVGFAKDVLHRLERRPLHQVTHQTGVYLVALASRSLQPGRPLHRKFLSACRIIEDGFIV